MWYVLILYFVAIFCWNVFVEEYEDNEESEAQLFLNTFYPVFGIAAAAILGLIF